ncbi:LacI family DNA-binding transcriptional regulator [Paenibacillus ginsengarvi]|uniref:LacI family transcriptional regulator n=1 Tax=Paenibacillus ginsengarvi TaxID=400777 RepID=A0A3B0CJK4_9BACL|nr:LacI family transcriptional regulator [Paenibacillus ginsengarvi]
MIVRIYKQRRKRAAWSRLRYRHIGGVTYVTVSRALNDEPAVSEQTRQAIFFDVPLTTIGPSIEQMTKRTLDILTMETTANGGWMKKYAAD